MSIKYLLILLSIFVTGIAWANESGLDRAKTADSVLLGGRWSSDCKSMDGIRFSEDNGAAIELNSNQIYIKVHTLTINPSIVEIYLDSPGDLGRGGMVLNWDKFSRLKEIAEIKVVSKTRFKLKWIGFFNSENKKYELVVDPDFINGSDVTEFEKCSA